MYQRFIIILFCAGCFGLPLPVGWAQSDKDTASESTAIKQRDKNKKSRELKETSPPKFSSFREAQRAGYELKNAGKLPASRDAYEAALTFESPESDKCNVYRELILIYPELDEWESTYKATEHIVENAPYPAFSSLSVSAMLSMVYRKKKQEEMFTRYEDKLEANPKDRTTLVILEKAVQQLKHDLPRRAGYLRRLIDLDIEEAKTPDPEMRSQLAFSLKLSKKEIEAAEMYEAIAKSNKEYHTYAVAQAADAWQRAGKMEKSLAAAIEASNLGPDVRATRSLYDWHRLLGDLFLKHLAKAPAKKHYTAALEHATIDPYREQCREQLKLVEALKD